VHDGETQAGAAGRNAGEPAEGHGLLRFTHPGGELQPWLGVAARSGQQARVRDDPGGTGGSSRAARREPPRLFIEHQVGDRVWTHSQGAWEIIGRELADDPGSAGLRSGRWLTGDHA
jgi:hypothetical protein